MHADLAAALARLEADLAAGAIDRAALFWLKVYVEQALAGGGALRSDRWIEAGLAAGAEIPGLSPAQLEPRQQLIAGYGLFHFVRLKDDAQFSGAGLADLDWQRKYRVSLTPAFAASLAELAAWVEARWSRLGGGRSALRQPGGSAGAPSPPAPLPGGEGGRTPLSLWERGWG
jgi:hypothetical protein